MQGVGRRKSVRGPGDEAAVLIVDPAPETIPARTDPIKQALPAILDGELILRLGDVAVDGGGGHARPESQDGDQFQNMYDQLPFEISLCTAVGTDGSHLREG